jgi:hypothetical protein
LLLAVSTWSSPQAPGPSEAVSRNGRSAATGASNGERPPDPVSQQQAGLAGRPAGRAAETAAAAGILRAAGWRVISVDSSTQLAAAWQQLAAFPVAPEHLHSTSNAGGAG